MKTVISAIVLAAASLGTAYADVLDYPLEPASASTLSRDQVRQELQQARAAGLVTFGELEYPAFAQDHAADVTRADVREELRHARAAGQVTFGELDYPAPAAG